jgi:hypothetical protein
MPCQASSDIGVERVKQQVPYAGCHIMCYHPVIDSRMQIFPPSHTIKMINFCVCLRQVVRDQDGQRPHPEVDSTIQQAHVMNCGILSYDTILSCRWLATILEEPVTSIFVVEVKMEVVGLSKTLVTIHKTT